MMHLFLKRKSLLWCLPVLILFISSCTTPLRDLTYMYDIKPGYIYTDKPAPDIYKVRSNDQLYIQVIGDDPLAVQFLNLMPVGSGSTMGGSSLELVTYIVNETGDISYPQFGLMRVAGLSIEEIREELQKKVNVHISGASVFVKLVNRTITVLGEVRSPGQHQMVKNQLSIFEAIGLSGDINDFGNRKKVKIVRETVEGRQVSEIDLTDPNLINSPFYYILPHDVLYIEPLAKVYGQKTMPVGTGLSLIFSTISTALLLINYFLK